MATAGPPSRLGLAELQSWVAARGAEVTWHRLAVETPTVPSAAAALGLAEDRVVKSLVFLAAGQPVLVLANGQRRVDSERLAAALDLPRTEIHFAREGQALALTGYPIGVMPPFGHCTPLRTLIDQAVLEQPQVVAGTGDPYSLLTISLAELLRLTAAESVHLTS